MLRDYPYRYAVDENDRDEGEEDINRKSRYELPEALEYVMTAIRVISPDSLIREHFVLKGLLVRVEVCGHYQVGDAAIGERSHHALVRALVVDGHSTHRVSDPHPDRRILDQNTQKGHRNEYWQQRSKGKRHDH